MIIRNSYCIALNDINIMKIIGFINKFTNAICSNCVICIEIKDVITCCMQSPDISSE